MKTCFIVGWTCRLRNYESNATWTDQNGVKTEKLWPKENNDKTVIRWKRILDLTEKNYVFKKKKAYFESNRGNLRFPERENILCN